MTLEHRRRPCRPYPAPPPHAGNPPAHAPGEAKREKGRGGSPPERGQQDASADFLTEEEMKPLIEEAVASTVRPLDRLRAAALAAAIARLPIS